MIRNIWGHLQNALADGEAGYEPPGLNWQHHCLVKQFNCYHPEILPEESREVLPSLDLPNTGEEINKNIRLDMKSKNLR